MKKKLAVVIIFIVVLVLPMVTWPIVSQFNLPTVDENREKAQFPKFGNDVFAQFDAYFADRAPYRDLLIKSYKSIERTLASWYAKLFPDYYTSIGDVILGQGGWLFYTGDNSLDYYKGVNLPTESELQNYVERAEKVNEFFKAQGKEFVIFIAPNKEQIYSEYMPKGVRVINQTKRAEVIYDYFKQHSDVTVLYPKEELLEAKNTRATYLQQDTHWNDYGAYVGAKAIFNSLQMPIGEVEVDDVVCTGGDLSLMAAMDPLKYTGYHVAYRPDVTFEYLVANKDGFTIETSNKNGKRLFVLGDSFSLADYSPGNLYRVGLKEILCKEYELSVVNHRNTFAEGKDYTEEFNSASTVIFQAVERYEQSIFADWGILQMFINVYGL